MKTIKLKNKVIVPVFEFLTDVNLKANKASRGRTQLLKRLEEKSKEYNDALDIIRKEYFKCDEGGELIVVANEYERKDQDNEQAMETDIKELNEELFEIQFGEYSTKYEALFDALGVLEQELNGIAAYGYNELMEQYELNEEEK